MPSIFCRMLLSSILKFNNQIVQLFEVDPHLFTRYKSTGGILILNQRFDALPV
jgi:hypothetical protein